MAFGMSALMSATTADCLAMPARRLAVPGAADQQAALGGNPTHVPGSTSTNRYSTEMRTCKLLLWNGLGLAERGDSFLKDPRPSKV